MVPATFKDLLKVLNVPLAAVVDLLSGEVKFIGDPKAVENTDLILTLFADRETINSLNRSLEGQVLPRVWSQGGVSCVLCKPNSETIVGLFITDELDAVQRYHWSKKTDEMIRSSISASESRSTRGGWGA